MPRVAVRRKLAEANNNNHTEDGAPNKKLGRIHYQLPKPTRLATVGKALVCGQGDMGQLGLGDDETKFERKRPAVIESIADVVDVRAGGMHNLVLTNDGRVYSFGCNDEGALGRDSSKDGSEFEPHEIELPDKVLKISAGDSHSACLLEDGRVFAWGSFRDSHGNMGLTLEGNKRLPIDVLPGMICSDIASGADHLVILTSSGKVYTVGCAEQGQLGRVSLRSLSGEGRRGKTDLLRPGQVIIKRGKPIEAIWATNYCTFLRESQTNKIWAFGLNNYKQLAYTENHIVEPAATIVNPIVTQFQNVKQIAGGQHHTLVLKDDGTCYVIGRRDYGRLGLGQLTDDVTDLQPIKVLAGKKIVSISCGEAQSFALTDDGKLYSWGMGSNHQLGTGSEDDVLEPVLIVSKQTQDRRVILASSGGQHSIFLVEDEIQPAEELLPSKPTLTKKAAAAAKAKEAQEAEERKKNEANETVNSIASDQVSSTAVDDNLIINDEVKTTNKRGRKKK